ncbi:hypothetical protein ACWEV4_03875 [Streptomyces sp. NPDC003860]
MERTAALRLDAEWTTGGGVGIGLTSAERHRTLMRLIDALAPHADGDPSVAARLGLRYAELARHHFEAGRRAPALSAAGEAVRHCAGPARHDPEHARWYARALTSRAIYLAHPLSDELGLPRYAFRGPGSRPSSAVRADGFAALAATRRAVAVWAGLDQAEPGNREGLAQAYAFLGDRLEELGDAVEAAAWAVRAERGLCALRADDRDDLRAVGDAAPGEPKPGRDGLHTALLEHLGDQLERRLRRCPFADGLARLRADDLLPERLLPLAVLAARIDGVEAGAIADGLRLALPEVERVLRARSWRAVWRFDTRDADGAPWTPMAYPWRGATAVTDRSAAAVGADLTDAFLTSPDRPPAPVHWRLAVWWEDEDHLDAARFRHDRAPGARS